MQRAIKSLKLSLIAGLLASLVVPAQAGMMDAITDFQKPNMKYGPLELHPFIKEAETYDSNIFLQPRSKLIGQNANNNAAGPVLGSWITDTEGGLGGTLGLSDLQKLDFNYDALWRAYSKDPRNNNTVNQTAGAGYTFKGSTLLGKLNDTYINTVDPATSELVTREKRWNNTAAGSLEYGPEGGNLFAAVDAGQSTDKYIANDPVIAGLLNRYTQTFGLKGGWKLGGTTRLYAAYHRQLIHYTDHPASPTKNNKAHLVDFGVEGQIAPKLTGQIQTGLQYRNYDDAAFTGAQKTTRNWMVATKLNYKPIERTSIDLTLSRALQEAVFNNNQFYIATSALVSVTHKLPYKLVGAANFAVETDKYPVTATVGGNTANRRDDLYQEGVSLTYPIQEWLKLDGSYTHRSRYSARFSEQFNYEDHLTTLRLSLLF